MASRACLEGSPRTVQYSEEDGVGQSVDENKALDNTSALLRPNLILATLLLENGQVHDMPDSEEGQTEKVLDSADAGGFVPDAVFDAASGERMVLNMFIVGEEADEVEVEAKEEIPEAPVSAIEAPAPLPAEAASVASHEAPVAETQSEAATPEDAQKEADRALCQSVIDGTVADILSPDLADALEAAFNRSQGDADMVNLFELAVGAYQNAMLAATSNLS